MPDHKGMAFNRNSSAPLYRACDYCGRNDWKVCLTYPAPVKVMSNRTHRHVGICPSCFSSKVERGAYETNTHGIVVTIDRRGERSKKQTPVPETLRRPERPAAPVEEPTMEDWNGRRVWSVCHHPAERDALDGCYTCQRALAS